VVVKKFPQILSLPVLGNGDPFQISKKESDEKIKFYPNFAQK
jgi:hypothetical protein